MTTPQAPLTTPPLEGEDAERSPSVARQRRRVIALITAGTLALGGVGGGVAWANHRQQQRTDAVVAEATAVVDQIIEADVAQDEAAAAATRLLADSQSMVANEASLTTLKEAIEAAELAALSTSTIDALDAASADGAALADAEHALALAKQDLERVLAANAPLAAAVSGVQESVEAKALDDAKKAAADAQTALDAAITTGEQVLAATDGKVEDNAVRQDLRNALDAARQAPADPDPRGSTRESWPNVAAARDEARRAVEAATQTVSDANEAWQAKHNNSTPGAEPDAATGTPNPSTPSRGVTGPAQPAPAKPAPAQPAPAEQPPAQPAPAEQPPAQPAPAEQPPAQPAPAPTYDMNKAIDDALNQNAHDNCFIDGVRSPGQC